MPNALAQAYADLERRARGSGADVRALRRDALALGAADDDLADAQPLAAAQRQLRAALPQAIAALARCAGADLDPALVDDGATIARFADDFLEPYARELDDVTRARALLTLARVAGQDSRAPRSAGAAVGRALEPLLLGGTLAARWLAFCAKLALGADPAGDDRLLGQLDLLVSAQPWPRDAAVARALRDSAALWILIDDPSEALVASTDDQTRSAALLALSCADDLGERRPRCLQLLDGYLAAEPVQIWRAAAIAFGRLAARGDEQARARLSTIGAGGAGRARGRHAAAALGALGDDHALQRALDAARDDPYLAGAVVFGLDELCDGAADPSPFSRWLERALSCGEPARRAAESLRRGLTRAGHPLAHTVDAALATPGDDGSTATQSAAFGARVDKLVARALAPVGAHDDGDHATATTSQAADLVRAIDDAAGQTRALRQDEPASAEDAARGRAALRDLVDALLEQRHAAALVAVLEDDDARRALRELEGRLRRDLVSSAARAAERSSAWRLELARGLGRAAAITPSNARTLRKRRRDADALGLRLEALTTLYGSAALLADKALRRLLAAELARAIAAFAVCHAPLREIAARTCVALAARVDTSLLREVCRNLANLTSGAPRDGTLAGASQLCEALLAFARGVADETPSGDVSAEAETLATARDAALLGNIADGARALAGEDSPTARRLRRLFTLADAEPRTPSPRSIAALVAELPALIDSIDHPLAPLRSSAPPAETDLALAARAAATESALDALADSDRRQAPAALENARREVAALRALLAPRRLLRPLTDALERAVSHAPIGPPTPAAWQAATVDLGPPSGEADADSAARDVAAAPLRVPDGDDDAASHDRATAPHLDDVEVISRLGSGGIGAVFAARQRSLDRMVAVKVLHPELARDPRQRERFRREAQMMARWHHPHIVRVYDFRETADGQAALLMELVDGERLSDVATSALPPARLCAIGAAIADALAHAHAAGVVHRDVSPDNVLLRRDGTALLSDFGIALLSGARRLTGAALVLGKPRYMSPEQLRGEAPTDAADVYALGVLLYERLAGVAPFEHDTLLGLLVLKEAARYTPLSEAAPRLPAALSALVTSMLAATPDARPSAAEAARELAALAAG